MKKLTYLVFTIILVTIMGTATFATSNVESDFSIKEENSIESEIVDDTVSEEKNAETIDNGDLDGASEEILGAVTKKDKRIAELSDKYNDKTLGMVAYYLELVRYYSTPIFFIFLTIGAFNFFIVGNKKLDKKEQGFGWITACIIGWVFFQCVPLIFSLFAI